MKRKYERRITNHQSRATNHEPRRRGSALILTVVLTTLLATLGVLFVLLSRIDKMAASATSENRQLNFAIDTVVAEISQELALDVPGVAGQEYHDYPGPEDRWLASLEPYEDDTNDYRWSQMSDVTGYLNYRRWSARNILITNSDPNPLLRAVIEDYRPIALDPNGLLLEQLADADGDGVADSKWIGLPDTTSSKGKPIYAAIRVIPNGAMLNVNTAYKFDPNNLNPSRVDGSSLLQINLMALAGRPPLPTWPVGNPYTLNDELNLRTARANGADVDPYSQYQNSVIWSYGEPTPYTPFDISDELELRYRFLLNHEDIDTRLEGWGGEFRDTILSTPVTTGGQELNKWFKRACFDPSILDPKIDSKDPNYYAYRHIATTYNMDRIIRPDGSKMLNVNTASAQELYDVLKKFIDPNLAAQLAVNIVDIRDNDVNVTVLPTGAKTYHGFEAQPFISEIVFTIDGNNPVTSANNYFAIELYNPFEVPIPLVGFRLELRRPGSSVPINLAGYSIPANSRFVIMNKGGLNDHIDPNLVLAKYKYDPGLKTYVLEESYDTYLLRKTSANDIYLDKQETQDGWFDWSTIQGVGQFYYRPDNNWNIVYQEMQTGSGTLGSANVPPNVPGTRTNYNIPTFKGGFVTIGDIARVLTVGPSPSPNDMIGVRLAPQPPENSVRINLADPGSYVQQIFSYLTVFDPNEHGLPSSETRIKGRININTAPWFVIAQLPWVSQKINKPTNYALAKAIVAYRDKTNIPGVDFRLRSGQRGFRSIGELMNVRTPGGDPNYSMCYYGLDSRDQLTFPDLTAPDGARDDFEEGDLIFSRISNLVTVRSDVFTAYILVRIGVDGPQKRVIAILDRSQVFSPTDKVKIIALQPVPDPR